MTKAGQGRGQQRRTLLLPPPHPTHRRPSICKLLPGNRIHSRWPPGCSVLPLASSRDTALIRRWESINSGCACRTCHSVLITAEAANEGFQFHEREANAVSKCDRNHKGGGGGDMHREFPAMCVSAATTHQQWKPARLDFPFACPPAHPLLHWPSVSDAHSDDGTSLLCRGDVFTKKKWIVTKHPGSQIISVSPPLWKMKPDGSH